MSTCNPPTDSSQQSTNTFSGNLESDPTYRQLLHVLDGPFDLPEKICVVKVACAAVNSYGRTLTTPTPLFREIETRIATLLGKVENNTTGSGEVPLPASPLYRRLSRHPAWSLCLTAATLDPQGEARVFQAIGVEIAICLAHAKTFRVGFANSIRRSLTPWLIQPLHTSSEKDWARTFDKTRASAAKLFESGNSPDPVSTDPIRLFDIQAGLQLHRRSLFAAPRRRQAVLDRGTQTPLQFQASARRLMELTINRDHSAILVLVSCFSGLTLKVTIDVPLAASADDDKWIMILDIATGTIKTNLDPLASKAASPKPEITDMRESSRVAVKPLPSFLAECLQALLADCPTARTLAELIPRARTSGRELTLPDDHSSIVPSAARFLASAAPIAIKLGTDRLSAALLFNNFAVIPRSKLYYCSITRREVWEASGAVFEAFGWGDPVPLAPGLPVGSRIVPTRMAIVAWHEWMINAVTNLRPGRHCSLVRLIDFHNSYSKLCASMAVFCLAAREVKVLRFNTLNLHANARECWFNDKWVGIFPGALPVPINQLLRRQIHLWLVHCTAVRRRLERLGDSTTRSLIRHLAAINAGDLRELFVELNLQTKCIKPLGTRDLRNWWPEHLRFDGDFGRHFWEAELRGMGVRSTHSDIHLRHLIEGVAPHTSISAESLAAVSGQISSAQDQLLLQLAIEPVPGLASK